MATQFRGQEIYCFFDSGHLSEMEPPLPISNREVKLFSADNSTPETGLEDRSWPESRKCRFNRFIISLFGGENLLKKCFYGKKSKKN